MRHPEEHMSDQKPQYVSDLIVQLLRDLGIEYVSMNPGATIRGLHESLVNYGGNRNPELVLCTHEEIAVAMAAGYYFATGRPMAAMVHAIAGLNHASIAVHGAWMARVPLLLLGGAEPFDAARRRPGVDWVHSAQVQAEVVRRYVKWDDTPMGVQSVVESLLRAYQVSMMEPRGPVYTCFEAELQEGTLPADFTMPDLRRFRVPPAPGGNREAVQETARALVEAEWPVFIVEGIATHPGGVAALESLAELLNAPVITVGTTFSLSNNHSLNVTGANDEVLKRADVVVAVGVHQLDVALKRPPQGSSELRDVAGDRAVHTRAGYEGRVSPNTKIVRVGMDDFFIRPWAAAHGRIVATDIAIPGSPAEVLQRLYETCEGSLQVDGAAKRVAARKAEAQRIHSTVRERSTVDPNSALWDARPVSTARLAAEVWRAIKDQDWVLAHGSLSGWERRLWEMDASRWVGAPAMGLGTGMGVAMGATLPYRGTGKVCVNIQRDGDFLFTPGSLWTMAHLQLPILTVMFNNRSYFQDEGHQRTMAQLRERSIETSRIGIRLEGPETDFATIARGFGIYAEGPVLDAKDIQPCLQRAVQTVREGRPALVDVVTQGR
jgi:thiamine pyrophosphate-dependent acetolactate synthase large subunit-like protein